MKIFETHAHLDHPQFASDRDAVIKSCSQQGIDFIINIGCDKQTTLDSIALAEKYEFVYASAGYHPHDAKEFDLDFLKKQAAHPKIIAIGEIGLDYYRYLSPKAIQQDVFRKQLQLAVELKKPVVVHNREANEDCLQILREFKPEKVVYHCFSGDVFYAREVLMEGWFISFTGNITYKNSNLAEVIRIIPFDRYFVETDCPYLAPHPLRGKRNDPRNLRYIIEKIAEIKGISPKLAAEQSYRNALKFFLNK
ncbi:MAG: TatD family hydrolase [Candidatus Cloacimonetes bacterium]|nr:TatD family hydrolase [Candidatus Cloacimonadota bacterium]